VTRPLVGGEDEIVFGIRHLYNSQLRLTRLIDGGGYPARSAKLIALQGRTGRLVGRAFEDAVARLFEIYGCAVKVRVKAIGGRRIEKEGRDLGDIDVLVVDSARRRMIVVDTKALGVGYNLDEMLKQSAQLIGSKNSAADRINDRVQWLLENRDVVAQEFDNPDLIDWPVEGLIVTDRILPGAHIAEGSVPVWSYAKLDGVLQDRLANDQHGVDRG
jgi:hypothetical protein